MEKVTRDNIEQHLFDFELELMGKTRVNLVDAYRWKFEFTMTRAQYMEFHGYAIKLIMKTLRISKNKALVAFERYWKEFGVRIKN
jgi:hypothetical protein